MRTIRTTLAVAASCLAVAGLAACGGSESSTTGGSSTSAAGQSTQAAPSGSSTAGQTQNTSVKPAAEAALVSCLKKQGVNSPTIKPGEVPTPPNGVSVQKFHEALLRCGVPAVGAPVTPTAGQVPLFNGRYTGPHLRAALTAFASCMRAHGVVLPHPNTTGKGPAFPIPPESSSGEQKLVAAEQVCFPLITNALHLKVKPAFHPASEKEREENEKARP